MSKGDPSKGLPTVVFKKGEAEHEIELGDQSAFDQFYQGIGYAVNVWAHIDRQLFECVHWCLGSSEQKAAIIYYRLKSQSERIELTHELLKATDLGVYATEWQEIYAEIKRLSPLRNILAHQPLHGQSILTNVSHIDPENPVRVESFLFVQTEEKELLRGERKAKRVDLPEVAKYCQEVQALHHRAIAFAKSVIPQ
jgi:hypothetical protein